MKNADPTNKEAVLTITQEFDAPRELVFKAFSEADALAEWWGPVGYKITVASLDFKPKGSFHFKMENEERVMWARFIYGRIVKPERIEFTLSFSDENMGVTRAPFFESWPLEIFNEVFLAEKNEKTIITFKSYPVNASEAEIESFKKNKLSFNQGLSATLNQLGIYLTKQRS